MELPQNWPEPIVRVQSLADSGITVIPQRYIKPPSERPKPDFDDTTPSINFPIVDMKGLGDAVALCPDIICLISSACKEWGFFQVVNHGVSPHLMRRMREVWREVFHLPLEQKQRYANSPMIWDGYGSHYTLEKDVSLDWADFFYLRILPLSLRKYDRWPAIPNSFRETIEEYTMEVNKLIKDLMRVLSLGLELEMEYLHKALGGEDAQTFMKANFYPKCPQPELTLGISAHCDFAGLTVLLDDDHVKGLQVRKGEAWLPIQLVPNALVVNVGYEIEVLSNGIYKSVEHRAVVNAEEERLSISLLCHPRSDIPIAPAKELVTPEFPPKYRTFTFDEFILNRVKRVSWTGQHDESFLMGK